MIINSVLDLVGNTPMIKLLDSGECRVYGKMETENPLRSIKDRAALAMIEAAERDGRLKKGQTVIEATSGNTGIGLAFVCAVKKYPLIITMPDTMSEERRRLLRAFGAKLILTDGKEGMKAAVKRAEALVEETGGLFVKQFDNEANKNAHRDNTAREILADLPEIDCLVAGVGSGGTITGIAEALKAYNKNIRIIAVEPQESPLLSKGTAGTHGIQGIGANFVPALLKLSLLDEIRTVSTDLAIETMHVLALDKGLLVGISSGAAFAVAKTVASEGKCKNIVVVLPDSGERYLS